MRVIWIKGKEGSLPPCKYINLIVRRKSSIVNPLSLPTPFSPSVILIDPLRKSTPILIIILWIEATSFANNAESSAKLNVAARRLQITISDVQSRSNMDQIPLKIEVKDYKGGVSGEITIIITTKFKKIENSENDLENSILNLFYPNNQLNAAI